MQQRQREALRAAAEGAPPEAQQMLACLQATAFLLSSCHVVLVMVERSDDAAMWALLQGAEMLVQGVPDVTAPHGSGSAPAPASRPADVVFVVVGGDDDTTGGCPSSFPAAAADLISSVFASSGLLAPHPARAICGPPAAAGAAADRGGGGPGGRVHFWALPHPAELLGQLEQHAGGPQRGGAARGGHAHGAQQQRAAAAAAAGALREGPWGRLAGRVLAHARRAFCRAAGEREWLRGCERAWGSLQGSPDLYEYFGRMLATVYAE
ncbi:hypothetical protein FOA52_003044 [Chlamydomonas sp. UWO 241]|nr:hypothetical protein FOA52_003044 [Chlamydomonas sp. UWO 241]